MKRNFEFESDANCCYNLCKRQHCGNELPREFQEFPTSSYQYTSGQYNCSKNTEEQYYDKSMSEGTQYTLPNEVVRNIAFSSQPYTNVGEKLPPKAIEQLQQEMFKESPEYKQKALILYNGVSESNVNTNQESDDDDKDIGPVSYYYPPLPSQSIMEWNPQPDMGMEIEEDTPDYMEQIKQTGLLGVPPLPMDDCSYIL